MSFTCGISVQKEAPGIEHAIGGLGVVSEAPMLLPVKREIAQGDGKTFVQKWQEIISAFLSSEKSTASAVSAAMSADQRSVSCPSGAAAFTPRSAGQSEGHVALLVGLDVKEFDSPGIPEPGEHNVATINRNSNSAAASNRRGNMNGDDRISSKSLNPQDPDGKKSSEVRLIDIFNAIVPAATSDSFVQPANLLKAPSPPKQLTSRPSPAECDHRSASTSRCDASPVGSASLVSREHIKLDGHVDVEGADVAGTSTSSSLDSSPMLMMHGVHDGDSAPAKDVQLFVQPGLPIRNDLHIRNAGGFASSSISGTWSGNPIDRVSTVERSGGGAFETTSFTQVLKTGITHRAAMAARDNVSGSLGTAHSFSSTMSSTSPTGTIPASIAPREESSAPSYPYASRSQFGLVTSNELTDRTGKASDVFGAIDDRGPSSQWTLAGSHRAEAGFQDASLGWVSVRAQAGAGGIHAVVIPASDAAGQILNMHLAGLNAHMTPQYEHLNPVTLSSPDAGLNSRDAAEHSAQHHGSGGNQSEAQQNQENSQSPQTDEIQSVSSPMVRVGIKSVEASIITAARNPGEQHVSVIV